MDKEKSSKLKKTVIAVTVIVVAVFIIVPMIIVGVSKVVRSASDDTKSYTERLEKTVADTVATEIYELESGLDGGAEKALSLICVRQDHGEYTVTSDRSNARVTMHFTENRDVSLEENLQNSVVAYSCLLLAAFDDVETVGWEYLADDEMKEGYFTREDAAKLLGANISRFKEANGIQLIMNIFGLND